jgi:hypothetical protein
MEVETFSPSVRPCEEPSSAVYEGQDEGVEGAMDEERNLPMMRRKLSAEEIVRKRADAQRLLDANAHLIYTLAGLGKLQVKMSYISAKNIIK